MIHTGTPLGLLAFLRNSMGEAQKDIAKLKEAIAKDEATAGIYYSQTQYHLAWYALDLLGSTTYSMRAAYYEHNCPADLKAMREISWGNMWNEEDQLNKATENQEWMISTLESAHRWILRSINPASRSTSPTSNYAEDYERKFHTQLWENAGDKTRLLVMQAINTERERQAEQYRAENAEKEAKRLAAEAALEAAKKARRAARRALRKEAQS